MEVESSVIFSAIATVAAVVGSHFRMSGKVEALSDRVKDLTTTTRANTDELVDLGSELAVIKSKVTNGTFVKREECAHCKKPTD